MIKNGVLTIRKPLNTMSAFQQFRQCKKRGWNAVNDAARMPPPDADALDRFEQARQVKEIAKGLFPGCVEIDRTKSLEEQLRDTAECLKGANPIADPIFLHGDQLCGCDFMVRENETWNIYGIKSSTKLEEEHWEELAYKACILEDASLNVGRCFAAHINKHYVRHLIIDPREFLVMEDVTDKVRDSMPEARRMIDEMRAVISVSVCPDQPIGSHCEEHECPLRSDCWAHMPPHNVTELYKGKKLGFQMISAGIQRIADIPTGQKLTDAQRIQVDAVRAGAPYTDRSRISGFLDGLKYPLAFIDFETIDRAVPLFDGTKPYQQVPFQFSALVIENPGAAPKQFAFLASDGCDPRRAFLEALKNALPPDGSVIAYNASFEIGRLKELSAAFAEYSTWIGSVLGRISDLLTPFREFGYYHPEQHGSCSLKAVLPALTAKGYDGLRIRDGKAAGRAYFQVAFGAMAQAEKDRIHDDLLEYCGLDTQGMVDLFYALEGAC